LNSFVDDNFSRGSNILKLINITLLTGLAISTAIGVISISVSTGSTYPIGYPEIPKVGNSTPICYIETDKGNVIDLTDMCRKGAKLSVATPIPKVAPLRDPVPVPNPTPMK
jgi:hypothetical protein